VRTTKRDLKLPARELKFVNVKMNEAQLALYSVIKEDLRAQASVLRSGRSAFDLARARRSVIRLLQAASVPEALAGTLTDSSGDLPQLMRAAIAEGPSARIVKAVEMARELASSGRKVLIWTIFTAAVEKLRNLLGDLNPTVIYGAIGTGSEDDEGTREGNLKKFKQDKSCWVMIANPAAASEGMSLHMHCHDAIYVDRSYNAAHYLQSIDRIHRLGLPDDVLTNIYILRNELPLGVGSIDLSVGRRLKTKIRNLEQLLEDPDLNDLALDEENASVPIDESISIEDIDDLIQEIEGCGRRLTDDLV
jgi:SNF2 family DNA or RNA helicase